MVPWWVGCLESEEEREYEATCQNCKIEFLYTFFSAFALVNINQWARFAMVPPSLLWKSNGVRCSSDQSFQGSLKAQRDRGVTSQVRSDF